MEVLETSEIRLFGLMAERLFFSLFLLVFTGLLACFKGYGEKEVFLIIIILAPKTGVFNHPHINT